MNRALLLVLLAAPLAGQMQTIALSADAEGRVVALSRDCRLWQIEGGRAAPISKELGAPGQCLDLAVAGQGAARRFYVTASGVGAGAMLLSFDVQGRSTKNWMVPTRRTISGVATTPNGETVYICSLQDAEVYSINISGKAEVTYLMQVAGATRLGPMALDAPRQRLYATDRFDGRLFSIDIPSHNFKTLAEGLGTPAALAIDPVDHRVFVADAARGKIMVLSPDRRGTAFIQFAPAVKLKEPLGIAFDRQRTLWVGDRGTGAIYGLAPNGSVTATIR
jgi:streptogramin lyase